MSAIMSTSPLEQRQGHTHLGTGLLRSSICRLCFTILACLFLLLSSACTSQPFAVTREPVTLRLVAADTCGPLVEQLAAGYEAARPWVTVQFEVLNTSMAERTLRGGGADLALLSWLQETSYEEPLWSQVFAHDGIAVIANPATPFDQTGLAHLEDIFRGRIQEWGGTVLVAVSRENGSGTRHVFDSTVLSIHKVAHTAVVMPSGEAVIDYVARTPGAIGYISTAHLAAYGTAGVHVLPVEGLLPTAETINDGSYPLVRPLYLATVAEPTGEAREFAQWTLGPDGQAILKQVTDW
jgi:phosphate transport system substrate-binding protein